MNNITILRFTIRVQRFTERFIILFLAGIICNAAMVAYKDREIIPYNGFIILGITLLLAIVRYVKKKDSFLDIIKRIIRDEWIAPLAIATIFGLALLAHL